MFFEDITPVEKLYEILTNAQSELCIEALNSILHRLATCERVLESLQVSEELISNISNESATLEMVNSLAIDSMATILSQNG